MPVLQKKALFSAFIICQVLRIIQNYMEVSPAKSLILSATIHGGSYFFIQPDLHTYVCLAENQMQTKEYEQVLKSLERMDKKWHRNEEYWILRIRYYVELKQGKELKETLEQSQQEHIYLSAKGKEALAFWQE